MSGLTIIPDKLGGVYLGGTFNHYVDAEHPYCFEKETAKQDIDIAVRNVSFAEVKSGYFTPKDEAKTISRHGAVNYYRFGPWSGAGAFDTSYDIKDLPSGKHDKILEAIVKGINKAGQPCFVTLGPNPQVTSKFPWGKNPDAYVKGFEYFMDYLTKHSKYVTPLLNLTAVADPSLFMYLPKSQYFKHIVLDGRHPQSGPGFKDIFDLPINMLQKVYPGVKFMIGDFATNVANRRAIYNEAVTYVASHASTVFGLLVYNMNEWGYQWAILQRQHKIDFAAALASQAPLFERTIQLQDGSYLSRSSLDAPKESCSEIESWWYTLHWKTVYERKLFEINTLESCFTGILTCDKNKANDHHELLAKLYVDLAMEIPRDQNFRQKNFEKAAAHIKVGLNTTDENDQIISWPPVRKIRKYFELKMRQAEIYRDSGQIVKCIKLCVEIMLELDNRNITFAHDVDDESIPGATARVQGILAEALTPQGPASNVRIAGQLYNAEQLYNQVIAWAAGQDKLSWITLFWIHGRANLDFNPKPSVLYVGALAKLGKAGLFVQQNRLNEALRLHVDLLNWDLVGKEKGGFLNLAFESLIGAMSACAATNNYQQAIKLFETALPWDKINGYEDLKEALVIEEDQDLRKGWITPQQRWELIKYRLNWVEIPVKLRIALRKIDFLKP